METVSTENYLSWRIDICRDPNPEDPRKNRDQMGHMICFHRRHNLGDKHDLTVERANEIAEDKFNYVSLPLFLFDHSGITMSTSPFADRWDSGQVGIIYVHRDEIRKEFQIKRNITDRIRMRVRNVLEAEVREYDAYITGNVFGYRIFDSETGEEIESCWGFYGDEKYCLESAKEVCNALQKSPCARTTECVCAQKGCHCGAFKGGG